ncbi:MAG: hypothetical protein HC876_19650 [Chloroflexaceae bacterium]|nr:hypothetical protein [Chloroflexaceae bacterium]NJO84804.1 hypothetical protein [Blastochloris sp.]
MRNSLASDMDMRGITIGRANSGGTKLISVSTDRPNIIRRLQAQNPGYEVIHPQHPFFRSRGVELRAGTPSGHAEQLLVKYSQLKLHTSRFSLVARDLKAVGVSRSQGPPLGGGPCSACINHFDDVVGGQIPLYWVGPVGKGLVPLILLGFGIEGINEEDIWVYR